MKNKLTFILAFIMVIGIFVIPVQAQTVSVIYNGTKLAFDVDPVIVNGRTMVPMRAIFEALGCSVYWNNESEQAIGLKNGKKVVVTIGNRTAYNGGDLVQIDQPPLLINDRTMVPLRFISEAYDCKVDWDDQTQTVSITSTDTTQHFYLFTSSFSELGDWVRDGTYLKGRTTRDSFLDNDLPIPEGKDAIAKFNVVVPGEYKVWVNARDYATNQPGSRYYQVGIDDDIRPEKKFGQHGAEGFVWEEVGVFHLDKGEHEFHLIDSSAFHARCNGVFITSNLSLAPSDSVDLAKICKPVPVLPDLPVTMYPDWTQEEFVAQKSHSIENDRYKIDFLRGETSNGPVVQNVVSVKDDGKWVEIKSRNEEFAYMLQRADFAKYENTLNPEMVIKTSFNLNGRDVNVVSDNFYEMAPVTWCIPTDFEVQADGSVTVFFQNHYADVQANFSMNDVLSEPLVNVSATAKQEGYYSLTAYNGNGVKYEDFDTVTAPLLYVKHALPDRAILVSEPFMFTPMNTLYYSKDRNKKGNGKELTNGLTVDPTIVRQGFSHPEDAQYATMFYTPDNLIRPHLTAPVMGVDNHFNQGESFSFKYRILSQFENWYDTFKYVGVDMYHTKDIRENYYASINDAIYNATDLWLDDYYGGWDDVAKSYYNMEAKDVTTQADPLEAVQRYALTDDLTILEERTVPTIAYILSRGTKSFQHTAEKAGLTSSYITTEVPSPVGQPVDYSASVFGGLYEMTQGRMPFLLKHALKDASAGAIPDIASLYKFTKDEGYYNMLIMKADDYLNTTSCMSGENYHNKVFTTGFVYTDYARLLNTLFLAYEYTGDEKYLEAADRAGQLTMTSTWNTGYHNGYDFNTIRIEEMHVPYVHDGNEHFFWHGSFRWRVGNPVGEDSVKSGLELGNYIPTEDVPGWLPAQAGLGTEHPFTPKYGAINQLNVWAGTIMRLAHYTKDDYYVTQARNAMIGRYSNYPGYGRERYIVHNMYPDYPYKGPDYTGIYYHHIPVFIGMVEDYIINDTLYRSNANIEFPVMAQYGYAYFDMNRYGHEPGKFYDEQNMWLWLDKGILTTDNKSVDYITARKEGVLGIALLNEKTEAVTTTVTLGEKIPNASAINGTIEVYDAVGNKSVADVTNGKVTLTIPAKGITSFVLRNEGIKNPSYIRSYTYSTELGQTVSEHKNGKGYVIQLSDSLYHAYTFVENKDLKQLEITYTADGETKTDVCTQYPFEFLIRVNDPNSAFEYTLKGTYQDGTTVDFGGGILKTIDNSTATGEDTSLTPTTGIYYSKDGSSIYTRDETKAKSFKPQKAVINRIGRAEVDGVSCWKFIVDKSTYPYEINEKNVADLKNTSVVMNWVHKSKHETITAASYVVKAELADNNSRIALYISSTIKLPSSVRAFDNANYNITMRVFHESPVNEKVGVEGDGSDIVVVKPTFKPTKLTLNGRGRSDAAWRYVVPVSAFPFKEVNELVLQGMKIKATYTNKSNSKDVRVLNSEIVKMEERADGKSVTLIIPPTDEVPLKNADGTLFDDANYDVEVILSMD